MGYKVINSILANSKIKKNKNQFLLILVLGHYANEADFIAFPSIQTLVENTDLHRTTVMRTLAKLEQSGEISIQHSKPNRYKILLPRVETKSRTIESDFSEQSKSRISRDEKSHFEPGKVAPKKCDPNTISVTPCLNTINETPDLNTFPSEPERTNGFDENELKEMKKFILERVEKGLMEIKTTVDLAAKYFLRSGDLAPEFQQWRENGQRHPEQRNSNLRAADVGKNYSDEQSSLPDEVEKRLEKLAEIVFPFVVERKLPDEIRTAVALQIKDGLLASEEDFLYCAVQNIFAAEGLQFDKEANRLLLDSLAAI